MSGKKHSAPARVVPEGTIEDVRRATVETDRMFDQEFRWPQIAGRRKRRLTSSKRRVPKVLAR